MISNRNLLLTLGTAAGFALAGCASSASTTATSSSTAPPATTTEAAAAPAVKGVGLDVANIDPSVAPCDDFFHFASGTWLKNTAIPPSEVRWGSFQQLADRNNAVSRQILEEAAASTSAPKGSNMQKVGDYYASAMDSTAIEKAGIMPLKPELARIAAVRDLKSLQAVIARQQTLGTGAFFRAYVGPDRKNSTVYAVSIGQGGLGMPDRDYYLKDDARSKTVRNAYVAYMTNTFKLMGESEAAAAKKAAAVLSLETRLAQASKTRVELRDPYANYNKMTLAEADKQFPNLGLSTMLAQN